MNTDTAERAKGINGYIKVGDLVKYVKNVGIKGVRFGVVVRIVPQINGSTLIFCHWGDSKKEAIEEKNNYPTWVLAPRVSLLNLPEKDHFQEMLEKFI